jgi:hypothetical protein
MNQILGTRNLFMRLIAAMIGTKSRTWLLLVKAFSFACGEVFFALEVKHELENMDVCGW